MNESNEWPAPDPVRFESLEKKEFAGFWIRLLATICDGLNAAIVLVPVAVVLLVLGVGQFETQLVVTIIQVLLIGWWAGTRGGSPLRRKLGVLIVDVGDRSFIGFGRGSARELIKAVIGMTMVLAPIAIVAVLAFLWMLWDPRKQTLYDKMVGTVVVRR